MRSWTSSRALTAALLWLAAWLTPQLSGSPAAAQVRIPAEATSPEEDVTPVLRRGQQLETERRWSEAVAHYEDAIKQFPDRRDLQDRAVLSRAHFDVTRRYNDESFRRGLLNTTEKALDIYSEVLSKVQTHYVHAPNWHDLVRRGTFMLEVALTEHAFLEEHLPDVPADRINTFRRELRTMTDGDVPQSRHDAREQVLAAARKAARDIRLNTTAVVWEYLCGATAALDEYSGFLTQQQLDDVFSQIEGNFVGLGIELKSENQALLIVNVINGSPADKGGLKKGERIVGVDGKLTTDVSTDTAADMLKGPEGSHVEVVVVDAAGNSRSVRLLRERIDVPSVEDVKIVDRDFAIGYFKLTSFQKTTSRDVDNALWQLHRQGMKSVIMDLRGNPGGLLTAAVEVADKFLASGTIVRTHGRNTNEDFDYKAHSVGTWRTPLIVLIDGDSASASEIFAGAIRDHRRGTIVGQRSYGKGSVQGIFPLSTSGAGVRLTTAKFYSPSGQAISQRGVTPDINVRSAAKPVVGATEPSLVSVTTAEDATLKAGVQAAKSQLSQR